MSDLNGEMMTTNDKVKAPLVRLPQLEASAEYFSRSPTLRDAAAVADHLMAEKPDVMSALEAKRLGELVGVREQAYEVMVRTAKVSTAVLLPTRNASLGGASRINQVLSALSGSSNPETAAEVAHVRAAVFGPVRDLTRLKPRVLWTTTNAIVRKLESTPGLRERLEALVTAGAVTEFLAAHQNYGKALGALGEKGEELPVFDIRSLTERLNQHIDRYVASVLASVEPDDPATENRAEAALRPILEARETNARRRAKPEDETVDAPTDPDPAPPPVDAVLGTD